MQKNDSEQPPLPETKKSVALSSNRDMTGAAPVEQSATLEYNKVYPGPNPKVYQQMSPVKVSLGPGDVPSFLVDAQNTARKSQASVGEAALADTRNNFTFPRSPLNSNRGISVMTPSEKVEVYSQGVSVMSHKDDLLGRFVASGTSAMSLTQKSFRERNEQVSQGRFRPIVWDATNQTEKKLVQEYLRKSAHSARIGTDPVEFEPETERAHF